MTRDLIVVLDETASRLVGAYDHAGVVILPVVTWRSLLDVLADFGCEPRAVVIDLSIPDAPASAATMAYTVSAFVPSARIIFGSARHDVEAVARDCGVLALPKPYGPRAFWTACGIVPASSTPLPETP